MRNRFIALIAPVGLAVCFALITPTEAGAACTSSQNEYDAHDLSGMWFRQGGDCGFGPEGSNPPLTPEGEARIKENVPTRPRHPLQQRVSDPTLSNDPALTCNPKGLTYMLVDTAHDHYEVVQLPTRILQMWQEERRLREIWLDGRELPSGNALASIGPSWYGMSVGRWEGDTLVVETVGLDDRAWLDTYGFPKSEEARLEERYTRVNATTIEVQLTLHDPKYYTAPWVSDKKIFKKEARNGDQVNNFGWYGLFSGLTELICAPINAGGSPSNPKGGE
jgi:hypothetical protein